MKTRLLLVSATTVAIAFAWPAIAADSAQDFVTKAAIGGMFEVDSSKIAEPKASNADVQGFAKTMIDDHGAANAKLKTIAGELKLQVPAELDAKHKADLETLNTANEPVDGPYVEMQRAAHAEAVTLFESYAKEGDNASLKTFAAETLPTLKMHQEMVEKLATAPEGEAAAPAASTTPAVATPDAAANTAAPVPGANSFTEGQAKSHIEHAGYSDVSGLTKDDQGIWRGKAMKDGKSTGVALDYQGNVVAVGN